MNKKLRIACHGFVKKDGNSINGAHFLILEELLKRGVEIDFYGKKNFSYPQELCKYQNFHLFDVKKPLINVLLKSLPNSSFKKMIIVVVNNLLPVGKSNSQLMRQEILANHRVNKYDLWFFLGYYSPFNFEDIPTISWVQGPPQQVQWNLIQKLRKKFISLCGVILYFQIKFAYALKIRSTKPTINNSDVLICGSQWSKDRLIEFVEYGVKPKIVKILPYPIDFNLFKLNSFRSNKKPTDNKIFLWLGRSEPRKRLDLLLDAYALVLQERQDVRLKIFGGFAWAPGYKKLIDRFEFPEYLEYQPYIDKTKVPELMAQSDVLIQPSEGENFGSSVAESLGCGLPVIVGPTNGTKDFISSSSFVFEDYTPESLKKTMLKAIEVIEQDRKMLALDAREAAEQHFNVSRIVDNLVDIFHEALKLYQPKLTKPFN